MIPNGLKSYITTPHNILALYTFLLAMLLTLLLLGSMKVSLPGPVCIIFRQLPSLLSFLSINVIMLHLFIPKGIDTDVLKETALFVGIPAGYIAAMQLIPAEGWMQLISLAIALPLLVYVISTVDGILSLLKNVVIAVAGGVAATVLILLIAPQLEGTIWIYGWMIITTVACFAASKFVLDKVSRRGGRPKSATNVDEEDRAVDEIPSDNVDSSESEEAGHSGQSVPNQLPAEYLSHIMGQYRLWVEMSDRDYQRLATTRWYFLTTYLILTSLVVVALTSEIIDVGAFSTIGMLIVGAILSSMWYKLAQSCIKRKHAKDYTALQLEQNLPPTARKPEPAAKSDLWFPWIFFALWSILAAASLLLDLPLVIEIAGTELR